MNEGSPASPAESEMQTAGLRRSALILYAMTSEDREWMFERLPAKVRALLDPMIGELRELGVATDRALLRDAMRQAESLQAEDSTPVAESDDQALEQFSSEVMARALNAEPAALIAKLLNCRSWSWRDPVMRQMGAHKRRQIQDALEVCAPTGGSESRLTTVLMRQLLIRVRQLRADCTSDPDAGRTGLAQVRALIFPWLHRFSPRPRA